MHSTLFSPEILLIIGVSFAMYYLGIVLRFYTFPGENPMPLGRQCAMGFIFAFPLVTSFLLVLRQAFFGAEVNEVAALAIMGILLEHGFVMNDTWTQKLKTIIDRNSSTPQTE